MKNIQLTAILKEIEVINKNNYDEDIEKLSTIINGLINSVKFQHAGRFDFSNNKEVITNELIKQVGIYSYADNVKQEIVNAITAFMSDLESEREMPKKFVSNKTEYFDSKLSTKWNKLKSSIVNILSSGNNVAKKLPDRNVK